MRIFVALLCCLLLGCRTEPTGKMPGIRAPEEDKSSADEEEPGRKAEPMLGRIDFPAGKETLHGFLCRPEKARRPSPGLVLIHDANGLNGWTKDQSFRLSLRGYVVLAVDLYRGEMPKDVEEAHILDRGLPEDQALGDLKAAVDYLASRPDVNPDAMGVLGFGMGGGYALQAAVHDPRVRAAVSCYGRLITDAELLKPLRGKLFCVFAGKDEGTSMDTIAQFIAAMNKAGKTMENPRFCGVCGYGFLDPSNAAAYGKATEADVKDAWKLIEGFLDRELRSNVPPRMRPMRRGGNDE